MIIRQKIFIIYKKIENAKFLPFRLPVWYDQLGSFDKNHILKHFVGAEDFILPFIIEENVKCAPLREIIDKNKIEKIDLIHIDTEGFDFKVLLQIDFKKYKPKIILFEHKHLVIEDINKAEFLLKNAKYVLTKYVDDILAIIEEE